jgi:hypothetical protein
MSANLPSGRCSRGTIVFDHCDLNHLLAEYIDCHNRQRPHSSLGFATPMGQPPPARAGQVDPRAVRCKQRLGGVLKHYYRKVA